MYDAAAYIDAFNPVLTTCQYASGGNWEQATKLELADATAPDKWARIDYSVAIEAFYILNDSRNIFIGLRYSEGLMEAKTPRQFITYAVQTIYEAKHLNIISMLKLLGKRLNADENTYISQAVKYAELGVVDFWKSSGSAVVRHASEPKIHALQISDRLRQYGILLGNDINYTALELAVTNPAAWLGIQVSTIEDGKFITDLDEVVKLANMI